MLNGPITRWLLHIALVGLMAMGSTSCSGVKPAMACVPADAVDIRYLGAAELRLGGVPGTYSKYHLVNRSDRVVEVELLVKEPVLIIHPHSVRTERHDPDGSWVWDTLSLSEYPGPEGKVRIGAGDQTDLYFFEETFRKLGQEYRARITDARSSREMRCEYHSAPYVFSSQP